jgi:hypothetical protein
MWSYRTDEYSCRYRKFGSDTTGKQAFRPDAWIVCRWIILTVGLGGGVVLFTYEFLGAFYGLHTLEVKDIFDGCRISHWRGVHGHEKTLISVLSARHYGLKRHEQNVSQTLHQMYNVWGSHSGLHDESGNVTMPHLFTSRYRVTSQQTRIFDTTCVGVPPRKTSFLRSAKDDLGLKIRGFYCLP